jgi:hypothetical protein
MWFELLESKSENEYSLFTITIIITSTINLI